jgi:nicotinamidase-related amidase
MILDPKQTAFLTLDFQSGILGRFPGVEGVVAKAAQAVEFARKRGFPVIHVGLGFSEGHPEIPDFESPFQMVKQHNLFVKGTPSAEFHGSLVRPGDRIVYKQRVSAFSENELGLLLRARRIDHLVFFGVATSGIVLSTLRYAFDRDFRSVVLQDACFDPDPEVHRVLSEKVFPRQATVTTVEALIAEHAA